MDKAGRIAKVRALYEGASTPGEKEAARQALKRMGVDPEDRQPGKRTNWSSMGEDFGTMTESLKRISMAMKALSVNLTPIQRELFSELVRQEMEKKDA